MLASVSLQRSKHTRDAGCLATLIKYCFFLIVLLLNKHDIYRDRERKLNVLYV